MAIHDIMDLDTFKLIIRSIAESENLEACGGVGADAAFGQFRAEHRLFE